MVSKIQLPHRCERGVYILQTRTNYRQSILYMYSMTLCILICFSVYLFCSSACLCVIRRSPGGASQKGADTQFVRPPRESSSSAVEDKCRSIAHTLVSSALTRCHPSSILFNGTDVNNC